MRQFVEECRKEWRRLGVPDPVANEMAADLEADLQEAEAEGATAEAVLGSSAFDPRSFAAAWARERGVIQAPPVVAPTPPSRRSWVPAAIAVFAGVAILGAMLALFAPQPQFHTTRLAVSSASIVPAIRTFPGRPSTLILPGQILPGQHRIAGRIELVDNDPRRKVQAVGLILLLVGVAGIVVTLVYRSRRLLRYS